MRLADLGDFCPPRVVERGGGQDQQGCVDGEREHQRDGGIEGREPQGFAPLGQGVAISAGLHDSGMQVEIMRHDRRAEDAEREIEHVGFGQDLARRRKAAHHVAPLRIRKCDLHAEAQGDHGEERDDESLHIAKADILKVEDEEHVQRRDHRRRLRAVIRTAG